MSHKGRILIVDDDVIMAGVLARLLQKDHDVVLAPSGIEALQLFELGFRFDAILSDLGMPGMDGAILYHNVVRIVPEQAPNMIFVTGRAPELVPRTLRHNPLVEKPVSYRHIRELVNDVVAKAKDRHLPVLQRSAASQR
jgi:CheY-like chemotaxis protein